MVLSFEKVFLLSGLLLLCVLPLLYFLKVKRQPASKPQHVELEM
jgi:DHA2 family multidrug resistance protein